MGEGHKSCWDNWESSSHRIEPPRHDFVVFEFK